jgi:hypothetical protein
MVKAVKLLDSVEIFDDLVVNHDKLNTSTCEMKSGSLIKINQDINFSVSMTSTFCWYCPLKLFPTSAANFVSPWLQTNPKEPDNFSNVPSILISLAFE